MRKLVAGMTMVVLMAGTVVWGGDTKKDKEKLQGTWTLKQVENKGKKIDIPEGKGLRMIINGDKVTMKGGKKGGEEGTVTIDATKKPKQITMTKKGGGPEDTLNGIYEIEGNTLKIGHALGGPKAPRPTSFTGDDVGVMIFKKAQ